MRVVDGIPLRVCLTKEIGPIGIVIFLYSSQSWHGKNASLGILISLPKNLTVLGVSECPIPQGSHSSLTSNSELFGSLQQTYCHLTHSVQDLRPLIIYNIVTARIKRDNYTFHLHRGLITMCQLLTYVQPLYLMVDLYATFNMTAVYGTGLFTSCLNSSMIGYSHLLLLHPPKLVLISVHLKEPWSDVIQGSSWMSWPSC